MNKSRIRILAINLVLVVAVAAIATWGWKALHPSAAAVTTTSTVVSVGNVSSTVSASGTVVSPGDVGVSPTISGTISSIKVKVGQRVSAGTVMATLENTTQRNALNQAKNALQTAQIQYRQSVQALQTAKDNADQNAVTYQSSVDTAKRTLNDFTTNMPLKSQTYQATVDAAKRTLTNSADVYKSYYDFYSPQGITLDYCKQWVGISASTTCVTLTNNYNTWQSALASYNNAVINQQLSVQSDSSTLTTNQLAVTNALTAQTNGIKKDQQAIVSAQNSLDLQRASMGVAVADPTAADFSVAQASLATAQKNYDATLIKAPVTGDVASISATVGSNAPTASNSTIGSVSGFIVLTNVSTLQIKAGFSESDEAKLTVGQSVDITFAALTNVNATGKVATIDLIPTTASGATTYSVYISVDGKVPGLKTGMTATATIITGSANNVLQVASQAVTSRGNRSTVNVITTVNGKEVTTPTPVVVGLIGDSSDQIISGVKAGTKVVLRTVSSSTSTNGFPAVGSPAGLGGAGLAGGGGGGGRGGRGGGFGG